MPRPKKKAGSPNWTAKNHKLSENAKAELLSLLGLDEPDDNSSRAKQAIEDVERGLAFHAGGVDALDKRPRAADYREALTPLIRKSSDLAQSLDELNFWIENELNSHETDISELKVSLRCLVDAITNTLKEKEACRSRGAPKKQALLVVVGKLRKIFHRYHIDTFSEDNEQPSQPRIRGKTAELSEKENEECDFVKFALDDANISHPKDIRTLFSKPDAALPQDREKVINNLVKRAIKDRPE